MLPRILSLSVVCLCAAPCLAQSRVLVKADVIATTTKGAPVTDLTARDIVIHENGGVRQVVFFRFAGPRHEMTQAGPNEFVNRPGPPVTVILLDRWNQREMTLATAWKDVSDALSHLENPERVYIYFLGNRADLVPVAPLPTAETDLHPLPTPTAAAMISKLADTVRSLNGLRDLANIDPMERADKTIQALHLVSAMGAIAGPKSLIWVTHGFPIQVLNLSQQWVDYSQPMLGVAMLAVHNQVSVYTVDQSAEGAGADPAGMSRTTLELISTATGGRWFASGRASDALKAVADDARGTYQLAYFSPVETGKPREHRLRIESTRKGVRLLARTGFTGDETSTDRDEVAEKVFGRQCHSPFDATEIGLRVMRTPKPSGAHLEIHIDPADLFLDHDDTGYHGGIHLKFALYHEGIFESAEPAIERMLHIVPEEYDGFMKNGLVVSRDVTAGSQIDQVRVMVFDLGLQGLGSITVPLK